MSGVPEIRIRAANAAPIRRDGDFVLYWMTAFRRPAWNFALDRAVEHARALEKPLVVLEALRAGYPWASDRLHAFVLAGMRNNREAFARQRVTYYPYVEATPGEGKGLVAALGRRAAVVVGDEYPGFFLPRMVAAAAGQLPVRFEVVDSNGLLPVRAAAQLYPTAYAFRWHLHRVLPDHLDHFPRARPLARVALPLLGGLPREVVERWPLMEGAEPAGLPIDHRVAPVSRQGGATAATTVWRRFLREGLSRYPEERSHPDADATSGLSPYLHFGHIAVHQVFADLAGDADWTPARLGRASGKKAGWWGLGVAAEAFLDELVTWREVGFNFSSRREDYDRYTALPEWSRRSLEEHAADRRPYRYTLEQFGAAATHDPLWNAAQVQLVREGRMHNYLRMLWGKKILEWTRDPEEAAAVMIELNNRYALDGRDPNSYAGIFWVLGRYDRPWAPERPIFGMVRYMSSTNTVRKLRVREYLRRYGGGETPARA